MAKAIYVSSLKVVIKSQLLTKFQLLLFYNYYYFTVVGRTSEMASVKTKTLSSDAADSTYLLQHFGVDTSGAVNLYFVSTRDGNCK